jgi:hypothetical protein
LTLGTALDALDVLVTEHPPAPVGLLVAERLPLLMLGELSAIQSWGAGRPFIQCCCSDQVEPRSGVRGLGEAEDLVVGTR